MSLISVDNDIYSLSSSPNYTIQLFEPKYYKLYEYKTFDTNILICGSFYIITSEEYVKQMETFINLQNISIQLNKKKYVINTDSLNIDNIDDDIHYTDTKCMGETLQKEFYIYKKKPIVIKLIKNKYTCNNLVEISTEIQDDNNILNFDNTISSYDNQHRSKPIKIPNRKYI